MKRSPNKRAKRRQCADCTELAPPKHKYCDDCREKRSRYMPTLEEIWSMAEQIRLERNEHPGSVYDRNLHKYREPRIVRCSIRMGE